MIKCVCGRSCKGRRGLSAHQRCCTAAKSLSGQYQTQASDTVSDHNDSLDGDTTPPVDANAPFVHDDVHSEKSPSESNDNAFKSGVRLPTNKSDWDLANAFIHSIFNEYDWNQLSSNFDHVVSDIPAPNLFILRNYLRFSIIACFSIRGKISKQINQGA